MTPNRFIKQGFNIGSFFIAAAVLVFLIGSVYYLVTKPDIGVLWSEDGQIYYTTPNNLLHSGDQIIALGDVAIDDPFFYITYLQSLDQPNPDGTVDFTIKRNGAELQLPIPIVEQKSLPIIFNSALPNIIAFFFWITGLLILQFSHREHYQGLLLFLNYQFVSIILIGGNLPGLGWPRLLTTALIWYMTPLIIHFHLNFPIPTITPILRRGLIFSYGVAVLGSVFYFILFPSNPATPLSGLWLQVQSLYLILYFSWQVLGLLFVLFLLIRAYRVTGTAEARRQVGLVTFSGLIAILPLLSLSLLPQFLIGEPIVSYGITLLFLLALPVGYGYAIMRFKFIKIERYISRSFTAFLVIILIISLYIVFEQLLYLLIPNALQDFTWVRLIVFIIPLLVFNPLYNRLRIVSDHMFFGGWYDYSSVVDKVTHSLVETADIDALAQTLNRSIQNAMRVHWTCLLLPGLEPNKIILATAGDGAATDWLELEKIETYKSISHYLDSVKRPSSRQEILAALDQSKLSATEVRLLNFEQARLFVSIHGRAQTKGTLILGPKFGGDVFDRYDMHILDAVARQASIAFQNAQLIAELEERARETEAYQREFTRVREEERRRLARDLHDQVIQALIGFKYRLANIQTDWTAQHPEVKVDDDSAKLQEDIRQLIDTTRDMCRNLRPPALDLGLAPSIRSAINKFETMNSAEVCLEIIGDRETALSEDVALVLFRCTQEALQNIHKHAAAQKVQVELEMNSEYICLTVKDDGCGFVLPRRLGNFMNDNHFGLAGMRERLELVHGSLHIASTPGMGTQLKAQIPLEN